jgi:hypothetical protein
MRVLPSLSVFTEAWLFEISYIHVLDDLEPAWLFQFVAFRPSPARQAPRVCSDNTHLDHLYLKQLRAHTFRYL